jgi:hypothetical protein
MGRKLHPLSRCAAFLFTSLLCTACTDYDYTVNPGGQAAATAIQPGNETRLDIPPLQYHMQTAGGRLVVFIYNPTPEPIKMVGSKSTVTDPDGLAHPMVSQLVPPNASIKMIIPPELPESSREADTGGASAPGPFAANDQPGYILPSGPDNVTPGPPALNDPHYWTWSTPGPVHLSLTFQTPERTFVQTFTVGRTRK